MYAGVLVMKYKDGTATKYNTKNRYLLFFNNINTIPAKIAKNPEAKIYFNRLTAGKVIIKSA